MDIKIEKMNLDSLEKISPMLTNEFDNYWSIDILKQELFLKDNHYFIAKLDNEIIGFCGVKILFDTADLMNIVVKKIYRKNGVGTLLLEYLISYCKNLNVSSIFLEVNIENVYATNLYSNIGFSKISVRKNYYKDKDAFVMKLDLQ